jgi:tripartite-type tricarboxylate transporter receptor subunit TctC
MNENFRLGTAGFVAATMIAGLYTGVTVAQDYPAKAIRFVVPYAAGGSTDVIARVIAEKLSDALGRQVTVDNRTGAEGRIGTDLVAKAAPDGYTILQVSNFHSIAPNVSVKLSYDPVKDFTAIALTSFSPNLLVVHPSVPARSVPELVKLAKANPGKLNCGMSGSVQSPRLNLELLKTAAGINITVIPFRGGSEAISALLGGHTDLAFTSIVEAIPHVRHGALRALGITSVKRSAQAPDVRTMVESGFPGFVNVTWQGVLAPAGVPKQIATRLNAEIVKIMKMPDVVERLSKLGMEPAATGTPEEFSDYIRTEVARLGKIVKDAGIKPE